MKHWFETNGATVLKGLTKAQARDLTRVEGNAQGFRIITQTENHIFEGGLELTFATLGAFLKYPWTTSRKHKKHGAYISEAAVLTRVASTLGLITKGRAVWCRHPLAHVVEAADDICYAILDLEDAVELRILSFNEVSTALLRFLPPAEADRVRSSFALGNTQSRVPAHDVQFRVNLTRLRGAVFQHAIDGAYDSFRDNYDRIMRGDLPDGLIDSLPAGDSRRQLVSAAKDLSRARVFPDARKVELELGAYAIFDTLLSSLCQAAIDQADAFKRGRALGWKSATVMKLLGDHAPSTLNAKFVPGGWTRYQCLRRVMDFVSGMTDNYATYVARQLQGGGFSGGQRP